MRVYQARPAAEFPSRRRLKSAQPSGLVLIESLYFGAGPKAAQDQLQRLLGPEQSLRPFFLSDTGLPSVGMDIVPEDEIAYESFSPPASWNAAYSLQWVRFGAKEKAEYVFHPGEEILIPIQGEIAYHFFWSPGGRLPERVFLNAPVSEGNILRINSQIPHHAWASKGTATAWLVLRHATNSPVALVMEQDSSPLALQRPPASRSTQIKDQEPSSSLRTIFRRRVTASDLRKPGAYAMIAWGISELIRDTRQKTGLTTTDFANQIGIDPSSLSRLEGAKANVSIDLLAKVCRTLRIGMEERMDSGSWIYQREKLGAKRSTQAESILRVPPGPHTLHPYMCHLKEREQRTVPIGWRDDPTQITSWILLKGKVLLELPPAMGGKSLIVDNGNVMHFREQGNVQINALQDSTIVQIVPSRVCKCTPVGAVSTI
jgi:transcriptional regulator with XRE-family HTH domain